EPFAEGGGAREDQTGKKRKDGRRPHGSASGLDEQLELERVTAVAQVFVFARDGAELLGIGDEPAGAQEHVELEAAGKLALVKAGLNLDDRAVAPLDAEVELLRVVHGLVDRVRVHRGSEEHAV